MLPSFNTFLILKILKLQNRFNNHGNVGQTYPFGGVASIRVCDKRGYTLYLFLNPQSVKECYLICIINRPGVTGLFYKHLCHSLFN